MGLWRYSFVADKLSATMPLAKRLYSMVQEQDDSALMIGAGAAVGATHYFLGDFERRGPLWCFGRIVGIQTFGLVHVDQLRGRYDDPAMRNRDGRQTGRAARRDNTASRSAANLLF